MSVTLFFYLHAPLPLFHTSTQQPLFFHSSSNRPSLFNLPLFLLLSCALIHSCILPLLALPLYLASHFLCHSLTTLLSFPPPLTDPMCALCSRSWGPRSTSAHVGTGTKAPSVARKRKSLPKDWMDWITTFYFIFICTEPNQPSPKCKALPDSTYRAHSVQWRHRITDGFQ